MSNKPFKARHGLDANNEAVSNVANPVDGQDAVTRSWFYEKVTVYPFDDNIPYVSGEEVIVQYNNKLYKFIGGADHTPGDGWVPAEWQLLDTAGITWTIFTPTGPTPPDNQYTASSGDNVLVDTGTAVAEVILPTTPNPDDVIRVADLTPTGFATNFCTLVTGGNAIDGSTDNLVMKTGGQSIELTWLGNPINAWKITGTNLMDGGSYDAANPRGSLIYKLARSETPDSVPSDLETGELAVNLVDKEFFYGDPANSPQPFPFIHTERASAIKPNTVISWTTNDVNDVDANYDDGYMSMIAGEILGFGIGGIVTGKTDADGPMVGVIAGIDPNTDQIVGSITWTPTIPQWGPHPTTPNQMQTNLMHGLNEIKAVTRHDGFSIETQGFLSGNVPGILYAGDVKIRVNGADLGTSIFDLFGAFTWQSTYNAGTSYDTDDVVEYNGSSYISLVDSNVGNTPDVSPTEWDLMAEKGDQGIQGIQGDTGRGIDSVSVTPINELIIDYDDATQENAGAITLFTNYADDKLLRRRFHSGTTGIVAEYQIPFANTLVDTAGGDIIPNGNGIEVAESGLYEAIIHANVKSADTSGGVVEAYIKVNGATIPLTPVAKVPVTSITPATFASAGAIETMGKINTAGVLAATTTTVPFDAVDTDSTVNGVTSTATGFTLTTNAEDGIYKLIAQVPVNHTGINSNQAADIVELDILVNGTPQSVPVGTVGKNIIQGPNNIDQGTLIALEIELDLQPSLGNITLAAQTTGVGGTAGTYNIEAGGRFTIEKMFTQGAGAPGVDVDVEGSTLTYVCPVELLTTNIVTAYVAPAEGLTSFDLMPQATLTLKRCQTAQGQRGADGDQITAVDWTVSNELELTLLKNGGVIDTVTTSPFVYGEYKQQYINASNAVAPSQLDPTTGFVMMDTSVNGALTNILPPANQEWSMTIKDSFCNASVDSVTLLADGSDVIIDNTIPGSGTLVLSTDGESVKLISNGLGAIYVIR